MALKKGALLIPLILALVIMAIPTTYLVNKTLNKPKLIRPHSHQSNPKAKIKIVTFVDYECPPCVDVHETTKKVIAKNPDINLVIRHRIGEGHENAELAANAAEAAADQGRFWEMNDKLLENQKEWSKEENPQETFVKYANELSLNAQQFTQDFLSEKYAKIIETDEKDANGLNVNEIPTTFINGKNVGYAPSEEEIDFQISFLEKELENIEDDRDYGEDPQLTQDIIRYLILVGAPLIIIIGGLIVLGRTQDSRKRAQEIRKRIDKLKAQKKQR